MATRARFESGGGPVFAVMRICYLDSQFTSADANTEGPKARTTNTPDGVVGEKRPDTELHSAVVIARRIAASVALSSKRMLVASE